MGRLASMKGAAALFVVTWVIHSADHVRRGTAVTQDGVIWGGTVSAVLFTVALTLIFTDHPSAAVVSTAVFVAGALGVAGVHLLPGWGYFSEPLLVDSQADGWATIAATLEIVAAAWLGFVAWGEARRRRYRLFDGKVAVSA